MIEDTRAADLDRILGLAQIERIYRNSPRWTTDMETAMQAHGDAVDELYAELYRLLDERGAIQVPKKIDPVKQMRREIVARLKSELPFLVTQILDEFGPSEEIPS